MGKVLNVFQKYKPKRAVLFKYEGIVVSSIAHDLPTPY